MQYGNGELLRQTMPVVEGPVRVSVGVGTAELGPDAKMLGVLNYDEAFVELNRRMAENLKAAMANRPEVLFTVTPNGHHGAAAWGGRFPAAIKFLYPPVVK